jgi:hypothetical protein
MSAGFAPQAQHQYRHQPSFHITSKFTSQLASSSAPSDVSSSEATLEELKADLVRACTRDSGKPLLDEIQSLVRDLEDKAEQVGVGQSSASSGMLAGEWELLYSPEDVTRSSPFFWAFAQAFPDQSDQIFGITDSIPSPIKDVGPAFQTIELDPSLTTGKMVSRVKVATLNGMATSIMTTRADIEPFGIDGLKIRIDTTKPEDSTAIKTLFPGPLGNLINENAPPFPSGEALERVQPGSSTVIMRTTFADEGLRISRNDAKYNEPFIWRRCKFAGSESL